MFVVSSPSSQQAIQALRRVFSTHGLPQILVSDNGAAFTSSEFQAFVTRNGFKHVRSVPYHPATNGLAERAVQTVKEALKKTSSDIDTRLSRIFFQYRLTPDSTTGQSPAKLLLGRIPTQCHFFKNQKSKLLLLLLLLLFYNYNLITI